MENKYLYLIFPKLLPTSLIRTVSRYAGYCEHPVSEEVKHVFALQCPNTCTQLQKLDVEIARNNLQICVNEYFVYYFRFFPSLWRMTAQDQYNLKQKYRAVMRSVKVLYNELRLNISFNTFVMICRVAYKRKAVSIGSPRGLSCSYPHYPFNRVGAYSTNIADRVGNHPTLWWTKAQLLIEAKKLDVKSRNYWTKRKILQNIYPNLQFH